MPSKSKITFIEPLLTSAMVLERHIDACIRDSSPYGLTQFKILLSIERYVRRSKNKAKGIDKCSQSMIAECWGVSEAAISRQVSILDEDKLLTRSHDPDEQRRSVLKLTAKGKNFVSKTMRMVDRELSRIFRPISKTSRNQLASHLNKVLESLSKNTHHYDISDYNS